MSYSPIDKPTDFFNSVLYSGNGSTQSITGVGFQPDFIWQKERSSTSYHVVTDVVRGNTKQLFPNDTSEDVTSSNYITSFNSDGFGQGQNNDTNENSQTYVSWNWKAGTSVSGNTTGSGTAKAYTGSVNTTAGFSIIKYIGNDNASQTVPHHLGATPSMVIVKNLDAAVDGWMVYHKDIESGKNNLLNDAAMPYNSSATGYTKGINGVPTSTNLTFVSGSTSNQNVCGNNVNYIAYCFAQKKGYSKFSSYTGNGNADGTFVYTGFKPAFVMVKGVTSGPYWTIIDNKRTSSGFNPIDKWLYPNASDAELNASSYPNDFLSNGFKIRTTGSYFNSSGVSYIYMAFAESPFVGSNFVPNNAE